MKKIFAVASASFRSQMAYRFDVAMSAVASIARILFAYLIWRAAFGSRTSLGGFTFPEMFSYYVAVSFLAQIERSSAVSQTVSGDIRSGNFSRYMALPLRPSAYFAAQSMGGSAFYALFALVSSAAWVALFRAGFSITGNPLVLAQAAAMVVMGLLFMIELNYFLGILAFRFVDASFFLMVKENLVQFVTGTLVPLAFLPAGLVAAMRFLPFYYVTYLPAMLLVGKNGEEAWMGLAVIAAWLAFFAALNRFTYERLRVRYDGVGI